MYSGSCLCTAVQFEIHGPIRQIVHCHCSQCRKAQGSAFATNGYVDSDDFHLLSGEDHLTAYESSPGQYKYFCRTCGSPIFSRRMADPGRVRIRLGTVDSPVEERPGAHIFVSSRANWDEIGDELPCYDGYEPMR